MKTRTWRERQRAAFTIVELLVVIGIIALMGSLLFPSLQSAILRAQSSKCSANLHSIGVALLLAAADNNNTLPEINQAAAPVYPGNVLGIVGVLGPYGITTASIQCPIDIAQGAGSSFHLYGSSYEWNPVLDDGTDPVTVVPLGSIQLSINPARIRVCTDFLPLHRGRMNALYGDGHTTAR